MAKQLTKVDTYSMPADGWVCFHCGERFRKEGAAREHFGPRPSARAACLITAAELKVELMDYRKLEFRFGPLDDRNRKLYRASLEGVLATAERKVGP